MENSLHIPPGYRFHPTEEELVDYYLKKKVASPRTELNVIKDVDLYKIEPWDIQEICGRGINGEEREWYFFSHKDKKYPTGMRTNRATVSGFWKATGRDKPIYATKHGSLMIGMRKTLVFYKGRAPNGLKSDWIIHEYRLETDENGPSQEEGWVICRMFMKSLTMSSNFKNRTRMNVAMGDHDDESWITRMDAVSNGYYHHHHHHHHHHLPPLLESPRTLRASSSLCGDNDDDNGNIHGMLQGSDNDPSSRLHQYPLFSSETRDQDYDVNVTDEMMMMMGMMSTSSDHHHHHHQKLMDWRVLDKFVASQLIMSQEDDEEISNKDRSDSSR